MKIIFFILSLLAQGMFVFAQDIHVAKAEVVGNDTMPSFTMKEVIVFTKKFNSYQERSEFEKLKNNTLKVYPYVLIAVEIHKEMQRDLAAMNKNKQKKKYINEREKELREKFEAEIRNLTRTQGNILIKLINRETGNNCYHIVRELKGPMKAFFWNMAGKMYDHNLKEEYNPADNPDLEYIVKVLKGEPTTATAQ